MYVFHSIRRVGVQCIHSAVQCTLMNQICMKTMLIIFEVLLHYNYNRNRVIQSGIMVLLTVTHSYIQAIEAVMIV